MEKFNVEGPDIKGEMHILDEGEFMPEEDMNEQQRELLKGIEDTRSELTRMERLIKEHQIVTPSKCEEMNARLREFQDMIERFTFAMTGKV